MTNITHIQLHLGDFLGGVMQMDAAEIGAYTMLILAHYQAGKKGLPNDTKKLMQITHTNKKVWNRIKENILSKFELIDGFYVNKRVLEEIDRISEKAGSGRPKINKLVSPSRADMSSLSEPQVKNKSLILKETEKTNHKPITNNQYNIYKHHFDAFWREYPRKVGKGKAEEKYRIAIREIDPDEILRVVKVFAKDCKGKETEFIPHPATWLHQKRYFDETSAIEVEKQKIEWPEWKARIASHLGDHVVKSWFTTADMKQGVLSFTKKTEFDYVFQRHEIELKKTGILDIIFKAHEF